jgi:peptidoglycan hydrolase CwlO-like protein
MAIWIPVIVAVITGPLMWALVRLDRRNTAQHETAMHVHQANQTLLTALRDDVGDVKADVRDVKADVRELRGRVTELEYEV